MKYWHSLRVGIFLAYRGILRSNRYVAVLIVTILTLIFLNLVAVGGLLLGLIKGSETGYIKTYSGTLLAQPLRTEKFLQDADKLIDFAKTLPGFLSYAPRLQTGGKLEKDFRSRQKGSEGNSISATILGIDPVLEGQTTNMANKVLEGRFLYPGERDAIVLGSILAGRGATIAIGESLQEVYVGDKLLLTLGSGARKEYTLVGIVKSKNNLRNLQAIISLDEMRDIMNIRDYRLSEIAFKTDDPLNPMKFKDYFVNAGYDRINLLKTWDEGIGTAVKDINDSFGLIGNIVGGIGLMVGGITIFILIFVNAVSKRRFIGVLKASGISGGSVIVSYMIQGVFYTAVAVVIGMTTLYGFLVPFVDQNPIDFPFADGILYVSAEYAIVRIVILFAVSIVSGFVPAYLIVKENTLNAILGR
ncbi:FtsX-like permease family protein [Candidatus Peregrinibacteria bacterium]|nr:FtsX-like permease family protein [Candidatus Peregrinibacteria bacterium]